MEHSRNQLREQQMQGQQHGGSAFGRDIVKPYLLRISMLVMKH